MKLEYPSPGIDSDQELFVQTKEGIEVDKTDLDKKVKEAENPGPTSVSTIEKANRHNEDAMRIDALRTEIEAFVLPKKNDSTEVSGIDVIIEQQAARKKAEEIIESVKDFKPTKEFVSPSQFSGREIDDVAAVIAGIKPAALAGDQRAWRDVAKELYTIASERGYAVNDVGGFGGGIVKVVGSPERAKEIADLVKEHVGRDEADENYHRKLGKLLGYPEQSINDFITG